MYVHVCMCVHVMCVLYVCMYVCMHVCVHACVNVCLSVYLLPLEKSDQAGGPETYF